jgi:hypothetical protein
MSDRMNEWEKPPSCSNLWRRHCFTVGAAYNRKVRVPTDRCVRCGMPRPTRSKPQKQEMIDREDA